MISHCGGSPGVEHRLRYIKQLETAGLKLTKFGKCFSTTRVSDEALEQSLHQHKFYLAFENSLHCTDYITEKLWDKALRNGMVPIVMGPLKKDYIAALPLHSFIHVEDFESAEQLVEYVNYLDSNPIEYRKYFWWREQENMTDAVMMEVIRKQYPDIRVHAPPISICQRVMEQKRTGNKKIIHDLYEVVVSRNPKICYEGHINSVHDL